MVWFGKHIVLPILAGFLLFPPMVIGAQPPTLSDITVSNTHDDLLLHLKLEGAFREKIKRQILDGTATSFAFIIQLAQVHDLWFDHRIADLRVVHTIKYDNARKEFIVRRSWKNNEAEITTSFEEAQQWMNQIDDLKITPLGLMERGTQYQLRAKAEASKKNLPFHLHYILFFISFWDEETDWYIIDFTY
ncbi:MAG: DUF4390 domain-containing protein [Hyphomicrobiales bacterium]